MTDKFLEKEITTPFKIELYKQEVFLSIFDDKWHITKNAIKKNNKTIVANLSEAYDATLNVIFSHMRDVLTEIESIVRKIGEK